MNKKHRLMVGLFTWLCLFMAGSYCFDPTLAVAETDVPTLSEFVLENPTESMTEAVTQDIGDAFVETKELVQTTEPPVGTPEVVVTDIVETEVPEGISTNTTESIEVAVVSSEELTETALPATGTIIENTQVVEDVSEKSWIIQLNTNEFSSFLEKLSLYSEDVAIISELNTVIVAVPSILESEFLNTMTNESLVKSIELDSEIEPLEVIPDDPNYSTQQNLPLINASKGWELSTGSESIVIAVLDSGVDMDHPDLVDKILDGYDFVNNDADASDDNGHGTHVAGVAAASSNNATGISGISWGAKIMPVKVLNSAGGGSFSVLAQGIVWAVNQGADVINLSLGGENPSDLLAQAVDYATENNVVVIASSGNTGSAVLYPACYPEVIAVAATDNQNKHATFSNFGESVDVSAPGVDILSTANGGGYSYSTGTSLSAPQVSGLAAILLGLKKFDSVGDLTKVLTSTTLDLGASGWDSLFGWGIIQMDAAIRSIVVAPTNTPTEPPVIPSSEAPENEVTQTPTSKISNPAQSQSRTSTKTLTPAPTKTVNPPSTGTLNPTFAVETEIPVPNGSDDVFAAELSTEMSTTTAASDLQHTQMISLRTAGLLVLLTGIVLFYLFAKIYKNRPKE